MRPCVYIRDVLRWYVRLTVTGFASGIQIASETFAARLIANTLIFFSKERRTTGCRTKKRRTSE